ncbi:MAG: ABC transporter permease subunit [Candidatus Ozemobacteraceae bacterium]
MNGMWGRLWAIVVKDLREIRRNRQVWLPMIILPLMMTTFVPAVFFIGMEQTSKPMHDLQPLLKLLPPQMAILPDIQKLFFVAVNFMFPPLFLMIPLMAGSIIGASCLVGEKERKTLETLLYTPISLQELLWGKLLAAFIPSYAVTLISFALFTLIINLGISHYAIDMVFPNIKWMILITMVSPATILFGLSGMVIISAYATTFQGAQQLSGFIVMPFLFLTVGQTSGILVLESAHLLLFAPGLLILDFLILRFCARHISYERLLE